jgi:hypothetical protein
MPGVRCSLLVWAVLACVLSTNHVQAKCPSPYQVKDTDSDGIYGIASRCGCTGTDAYQRIIDMNRATLPNGGGVIMPGQALLLPDDCQPMKQSDVIALAVGLGVGIPAIAVAIWGVIVARRNRLCC